MESKLERPSVTEARKFVNVANLRKKFEKSQPSKDVSKVLLIPAVAIGNIGQFAIDIIRNDDNKVEHIDNNGFLYPYAGYDEIGRLNSSLEFQQLTESISLLQIRSMVVPGRSREFARFLIDLAIKKGFDEILLIGGASALALTYEDEFNRTRHIPRIIQGKHEDKSLSIPEGFLPFEGEVINLKLSGLLPFLYQESQTKNFKFTGLILFVFEGENGLDGIQMAKLVLKYLQLE